MKREVLVKTDICTEYISAVKARPEEISPRSVKLQAAKRKRVNGELRTRRIAVRKLERIPKVKAAAIRIAAKGYTQEVSLAGQVRKPAAVRQERTDPVRQKADTVLYGRTSDTIRQDAAAWNPGIRQKRYAGHTSNRCIVNGMAIRKPNNRTLHHITTVRSDKKAKAAEADAFFDSLPQDQRDKIDRNAGRMTKRTVGRRIKTAGAAAVVQAMSKKREDGRQSDQQVPYTDPAARQLVGTAVRVWSVNKYKKRIDVKQEYTAQREKLIWQEMKRQQNVRRAKQQQKMQSRITFIKERIAKSTRQVMSYVEEAVKKKVSQAKADAMKYVITAVSPFLVVLLLFVMVIIAVTGEAGVEEEQNRSASEVIEYAVTWAEETAADNSHGYNNAKDSRWGPDYSCSSFIIEAWEQAGVPVRTAGADYTSNMKKYFLQHGFLDITELVNLETGSGMQRGDVFINPGVHTEMAVSGIHFVGARGDAKSNKPQNGKVGDQGGEISISGFFPDGWEIVLRYVGNGDGYASGLGYQIVTYAKGFVGWLPYVWGGTSLESGADCSGFTQAIFAHFGISIPRTAEEQAVSGKAIADLSHAQAGDLIYYSGTETGHIGIYTGDGQIVHAANSRDGTKISSATYREISAIRRYIPDADSSDFSGSTNEEICWNFFLSQGFSPAATAGILGNFYIESNFDPSIHQIGGGPGRGLAQWESSSGGSGRFDSLVSYADSQGTFWDNLQTQLKFVMYELNSGKMNPFFSYVGGLNTFKASTDPAQAAYDWLVAYEYCGTGFNPSSFNLSGRQSYAVKCLQRHGG